MIEDIYRNNEFVPPKEQNLETIFEEPRRSKDGLPILTSVRKYKRYLHFDPTENKIQKRKQKAKKCFQKLKKNYRITRSSPKSANNDNISMYILDTLGDSSSDSDMETSPNLSSRSFSETYVNTERHIKSRTGSFSNAQDLCSDLFDTPMRPQPESRLSDEYEDSPLAASAGYLNNDEAPSTSVASVVDAPEQDVNDGTDDEKVQSPRRSCIIS